MLAMLPLASAKADRNVRSQYGSRHVEGLGLVAKDLGISRTTLWRRMEEYKIETRGTGGTDVAD